MNDLVVGTFGRGFYVLDDYSPLRQLTPEALEKPADAVPGARRGSCTCRRAQYGGRGKAFLGEAFYTADNPPFGATFTYHLKEALQTLKADAEGQGEQEGPECLYPTQDQLRAEAEEEEPAVLVTIANASGHAHPRLHRAGRGRASTASPGTCASRRRTCRGPRKPRKKAMRTSSGPPPAGRTSAPGKYQVSIALPRQALSHPGGGTCADHGALCRCPTAARGRYQGSASVSGGRSSNCSAT